MAKPNSSKQKKTTVRLICEVDPTFARRVRQKANSMDTKVAPVIRELLEEWLKKPRG